MTREYTQFYINGNWVDPSSKEIIEVINPANEEVCAHISLGNDSDVNKAPGVCVATWKPESCDPTDTALPLGETYVMANDLGIGVYTQGCSPENAGKRGCQPDMGQCEEGTEAQDGVCQKPGDPVLAGVGGETSLLGQDVARPSRRLVRKRMAEDSVPVPG